MQMAGQLQEMASIGVKGARGILARGCATGSAASTCLAGFCFERSQKWDRAAAPFLGSLFSQNNILWPLVFGAAWRSLGAALRPPLCVLVDGRGWHK